MLGTSRSGYPKARNRFASRRIVTHPDAPRDLLLLTAHHMLLTLLDLRHCDLWNPIFTDKASLMSDATPKSSCCTLRTSIPQDLARAVVGAYRLTLSPLVGYDCRHLPTCSQYADEAIERHGLWAGGWMTLARLSRCHPLGTSGLDFVPSALFPNSRWYLPWRYGRWRGVNNVP
jgi:putative membrane protein insertion efficiency factor